MSASELRFLGYRRPDGAVGVRSLVAVIAAMDIANPAVRRIVSQVQGTVALCPSFGRGQLGRDYEQHLRTMAGLGSSPNVAAAVVVSLEAASAKEIAKRIGETGRPVHTIVFDQIGGTVKAVEDGVRVASRMAHEASAVPRESVPLSELTLGVECGGSDTSSGVASNPATGYVADRIVEAGGTVILSEPVEWMGAEHILAARAVDQGVAAEIYRVVKSYDDYALSVGEDLLGSNPAPDNIAGGLSSIEEKALGAIKKAGSSPIMEVVDYAVRPSKRGLVLMDAPSAGTENLTALASGGAQVIIFSTGRGNPIGNPVAPTIKVSGNPRTVSRVADNLDVDVSPVLAGTETIAQAGERLLRQLLEVANGRLTRCELLGDLEIAVSRVGLSV